MNRISRMVAGCLCIAACCSAPAQEGGNAAEALAARQEMEERLKRLNTDIETLQAAHAALQKRLSSLIEEWEQVRAELGRNNARFASQDDIQYLTDKVREIDRKREADREEILNAIKRLATVPPAPAPGERPQAEGRNDGSGKPGGGKPVTEKGYWYVVQTNDTVSSIVQEYRKQGVKVSVQQVLEANPKIDPARLLPGRTKLWIPEPAAD